MLFLCPFLPIRDGESVFCHLAWAPGWPDIGHILQGVSVRAFLDGIDMGIHRQQIAFLNAKEPHAVT